jgi:UDP:flavonoid glycosyltransferase YjiC (YdhE family)
LSHILVCSVPSPGHVEPMLAAAEHLKSVGHSITFHTSENFRSRVEAAGVRFVEMRGSANYDYRIPIDAQKEKNLTSLEFCTFMQQL